jgi:hypothetical protein
MQTWLCHQHGGNRRDPWRSGQIKKLVTESANDGGNGRLQGKDDGFKVAWLHFEKFEVISEFGLPLFSFRNFSMFKMVVSFRES